MKTLRIIAIFITFTYISCEISPEPINYNYDECSYCKMKISDPRFGAEMVTTKGKIHKYDSAECLVNTYLENDPELYAHVVITDYETPKTLSDAFTATFLISEKQPSPMGGNLSAYQNKENAISVKDEKGGKILSFQELLIEYNSKK